MINRRNFQSKLPMLFASCALTGTLLSGCANTKIADSESIHSQAIAEAASSKQSAEELLSNAQQMLNQAFTDKLDFFAPLHLQRAVETLARADKIKIDPKQASGVAKEAIAAKSFLEKGYANKQLVLTHLKPALDQINILKSLNTPALLPDDYEDSIDDTVFIIKIIEGGKLTEAKEKQTQLIADMIQVEIDTLKKVHLSEAIQFLEKADDVDADDFAERTLKAADKKLEAAHSFIENNYRDRAGVAREGVEALRKAQKAFFVAVEAKELVKMSKEEAEEHVVKIMAALQEIARSMKSNALAPDSFDNMVQQLKTKGASARTPSVSVSAITTAPSIEVEQIEDQSLALEAETIPLEEATTNPNDLVIEEIQTTTEEPNPAPPAPNEIAENEPAEAEKSIPEASSTTDTKETTEPDSTAEKSN